MSQRVKRNWALVNFLMQDIPLAQVKTVLTTLSPEQVNSIGEIAVNALYGTIPLKEHHKKALKKYSNKIEYIGDKANSVKNRKHVIESNPKAVVLLLKATKPILSSLTK